MYTRAKKILASEMMYALEKDRGRGRGLPRRDPPAPASTRWPARAPSGPMLEAVALLVAAGSGERLGASRAQGVRRRWRAARCSSGRWTRCGRRGSRTSWSRCPRERGARGCVGVRGGATRSESVRAALAAAAGLRTRWSCTTRRGRWSSRRSSPPCWPRWTSADCAIAAARVTDTIKEAGSRRRVVATLDRSRLWAIQTPQAFRRAALEAALDVDDGDPRRAPPTTPGWSSARAAACAWCRRRRRTSRSPRRTTCGSPSSCSPRRHFVALRATRRLLAAPSRVAISVSPVAVGRRSSSRSPSG